MTPSRKTGNKFFIIGSRRFQNELIAAQLEQKTGNVCHVLEHINLIPKNNSGNPKHSNLVLWDCKGKNPQILMAELTSYTRQKQPSTFVVLYNVSPNLDIKKKFVLKGIHGVFYEHDSSDIFFKGIQAILNGKLWFSREMMTKCIFEVNVKNKSLESSNQDLTQRQIEILALVGVGTSNDGIADKLCISHHTVKAHLYRIFKKINVPNRIQAALWAAQNL